MKSDNGSESQGTQQLEGDDPEPTGRATPVTVRPKRPASAKPRAAVTKANVARSASARPGASEGAPPARSRRAPAKAPAKKTGSAAAKGSRPRRSRNAPAADASIPPAWSDVDERGKAVAPAEVSPLLPAPMPSLVSPPDVDGDARSAILPTPAHSPRSRISPYVKAAFGILAAVSLVFVARGFVRRGHPPVQVSASPATPVAVEPAPVPAEGAPVEPTLESITPPADTNPESAEGLKQASLEALEHRKLDDAVAAGEKATLLDPTDADAWLILGAAYHDHGDFLAARRSYAACAKQATRGEVRECKFLLR